MKPTTRRNIIERVAITLLLVGAVTSVAGAYILVRGLLSILWGR